jgi:crotonobetaine/carnitine-CoA ligase
MNMPQLIQESCRRFPEKTFLFFQNEQISYRTFGENVYRAANWFRRMGIRKGDRVCISLPNCPEFLYIWMGLSQIGGIMVPINVAFKEKEATYILRHSECVALVGNEETLEVTTKERQDLSFLKYIISIEDKVSFPEILSFSAFKQEDSELKTSVDIRDNDVSSIMYTSGTTGPPKGVMVTHRAYVCCGQGYTYWAAITDEDRLFTCLPLYHANAQYYSTMGSLAAGASLILVNRFSASRFWDQIRQYNATIFNFIGAMVVILLKQPENPSDSQNNVRVAYGTPALDKELQDRFEERFGLTVLAGYALTECPFGTIQPLQGIRKPKSIGIPRFHPEFENQISVVNERGEELPPGEVGELVIKNPTVTPGYFRDPEETKKVLRKGWLYTGDNAYRDEDGYFFFVDRKKDVIRRRGENFSSLEIEEVLNAHPKVLESAVIGVPSELSDEEIKAYVIPKPGEMIEPTEIFEWCEKRLARFKIPRYLEFREGLPKTPTHRVEKYKLRQEKGNLTEGCVDRAKLDS